MNRNEYGDGKAGAGSDWCCTDANEREQHYAIGWNHLIILLYLSTGKNEMFSGMKSPTLLQNLPVTTQCSISS